MVTLVSSATPATVRADPLPEIPTLTVSPSCGGGESDESFQVAVTVGGSGFEGGRAVVLYFDEQFNAGPFTVDANGTFTASTTVSLGGSGEADIEAYYQDTIPVNASPDPATEVTRTYIQPCASPAISLGPPDCGNPGTQLNVPITGTGFDGGVPIVITATDFRAEAGANYGSTSVPAHDGDNFSAVLPVTLPGTGVYAVVASEQPSQSLAPVILDFRSPHAIAYLVVPCSQLVVIPNCVVAASGRLALHLVGYGFQPDRSVSVVFDPGLPPDHQPELFERASSDSNGNWQAEIAPFARAPGTYDVIATQSNDSPIFHTTHLTTQLTIADPSLGCPSPTLTPKPTCAPPLLNGELPTNVPLSVHGAGFQPLQPVSVNFDNSEVAAPVNVALDGTFDTAFPNGVAARPYGAYPITAVQDISGAQPVTVQFSMPCATPNPKVTAVKPSCGPDVNSQPPPSSYSIEVIGKGFIPGTAQIVFDATGNPEPAVTVQIADNGKLDATIKPPARPPNTYHSYVEQSDANRVLYQIPFDFTVPCTAATIPTITITPGTVPPGFVVTVHGDGFTAGATVDLFWSVGLGASIPIETTAAADGTFDRQVLIFEHDFSGARQMTAGTPANRGAFPTTTASLLVTTGQGTPSGYSIFGGSPSNEQPIILRR